MSGVKSINGSVKWLGVPDSLRTNVTPCTDIILAPSPDWGIRGNGKNPNWGSQPGGPYGNIAVLWSRPIISMPAYVSRIWENMRSSARRVREDLLRENHLTHRESLHLPQHTPQSSGQSTGL